MNPQRPSHAPLPSQLTERVLAHPPMLRVLGDAVTRPERVVRCPASDHEIDAFVRSVIATERGGDRVDASPFAMMLLRAARARRRRQQLGRIAWGIAGCLAFALLLGLLGLMLAGGVR